MFITPGDRERGGEKQVLTSTRNHLRITLGAKCGFAPSADFVAQCLGLSFAHAHPRRFTQSAHVQRAKGGGGTPHAYRIYTYYLCD